MRRCLIVNADDFGLGPGVNRGIIEAHETGIVTSTSLMVRWPAAAAAAEYARRRAELSLGLHLDLGEWACHGGEWTTLYEVVPLGDAGAVRAEIGRQLDSFRRLAGRDPTHLDSHQHVHRREPLRSAAAAMAASLGVPLRHESPEVRYCGDFYGQTTEGEPLPGAVSLDALLRILRGLPAGVTELACHPGYADSLATMYAAERAVELRTLTNPAARRAIRHFGIELMAFPAMEWVA